MVIGYVLYFLDAFYFIESIKGRILLSYSSLPKFIATRLRLHLVRPVYRSSSNETLNVVMFSYLGSNMRNTNSLSQPLNEFIVEIFIVPLFIQK